MAVSNWLKDKNGPQVFRLFGWAGTGKSTLARYLAEGVRSVKYAAFTGKAALVMRKKGCRGASTIHSLIYTLVSEKEGEPRFALDRRALPLQRDDIAIERADADAELVGQLAPGHRPPMTAQELDEIEQPFGARQDGSFSPAGRLS